ncbi:MAG: DUF87 domain-containing protein [Phycisphaeraceae bacterium]|nr:DUF87 domain-containing protein [Phycisphaerales bacterium]MCB9841699.1 DUF87 domain-containing protein [Phycisphaeraceae bacterium]
MDTQDYERLGRFYLGKRYDLDSGAVTDDMVHYDSKDLTTHALCVGMTGSGKTGLCIGLLEEAALDGIPALVIDPKGDLSNLLLTFPELRAEDFEPWVNADDARKKGVSVQEFAQKQAELWRRGLGDWGQDGERIGRLKESADFAVYTPGSSAGLGLSILRSFDAPEPEIVGDADLFRERVSSTATSVLGLVGIDADPVQSREHILISTILGDAWAKGESVDLATLIARVQTPPVQRVGVMDIDTFFPSKDRFALAMKLNGVVASPSFSSWTEGEALDIQNLMYTREGKPRVSILSIAHLSDAERMFFVSTLLNRVVGWVRSQPGTTSLRALIYMDEIAGYCPPVLNVPSKGPLLTLMKQARAFGVGVVLATQNPVDLDYKGLSNAGTWFIGRLQTERDKERVLDGLEGAATGSFSRAEMDRTLSRLSSRVFLLHNVHEAAPIVMHTRWVMSYLRGPLTREQIRSLMAARKAQDAMRVNKPRDERETAPPVPVRAPTPATSAAASAPILPDWLMPYFIPVRERGGAGESLRYDAGILASASARFTDTKLGLDEERQFIRLAMMHEGPVTVDWERAQASVFRAEDLDRSGERGAAFGDVPRDATLKTPYKEWERDFKSAVYQDERLTVWRCEALDEHSRAGESDREFVLRMQIVSRERRDQMVEDTRRKFAPKLAMLEERLRKAEQRVEVQKAQARDAKRNAFVSFLLAIVSVFASKKKASSGNFGRAGTAARGVSRSAREAGDVKRAEESVEAVQQQIDELNAQFERELKEAEQHLADLSGHIERVEVPARKTGIDVRHCSFVWVPFWVGADGASRPAW